MKNVGFIGAGNMGFALMFHMKDAAMLNVYDILPEVSLRAHEKAGASMKKDITELVTASDIVFIAVKPQFIQEVLPEMKAAWKPGKIIASIVAGKEIAFYQDEFKAVDPAVKVARIMPNTPALVKEAMNTVCFSESMTKEDHDEIVHLLSCTGKVKELRETQIDAAMGIAGCSPAYVYMFIEALADAGVAGGIFRKDAYELAAQTVLGAARMVLETGEHPAKLKDDVCSPGGTTIKGVMALEDRGFRASVEKAVKASMGLE